MTHTIPDTVPGNPADPETAALELIVRIPAASSATTARHGMRCKTSRRCCGVSEEVGFPGHRAESEGLRGGRAAY
jgi:hypothetical protein